ncbi:MAG: hypothetical protein HY934_05225 [Candidatus Firestonebacteria bacterium]|nr:hypothetical protein [Candidatus Firestonebacteria bacterium]
MGRDISDEEVGIRSFHLRRDRAVEQSIDKIRQKLGTEWHKISYNETQALHWVLGEVWSFIARESWNNIVFSLMEYDDVKKILDIATKIMHHELLGTLGLEEIHKILETKRIPTNL